MRASKAAPSWACSSARSLRIESCPTLYEQACPGSTQSDGARGEHGVSRSADQWIPGSSGGQSQRSTSVTTSDGARIVWASMYSMACKGFNPLQPLMEDHNMEDHTYTPHSP